MTNWQSISSTSKDSQTTVKTDSKKLKKPLDKPRFVCYIILMMNEIDEQTQKLLDMVCEGIEVASEREEQETADWQND